MYLTSTVGVILTFAFFQKLIEFIESSRIGSELNEDIYQNITPVCENEFCKDRDKSEFLSIYYGCQCDEMCSVYEDCCRDSPFFIPSEVPIKNFSCVRIPIAFSQQVPMKMITSCPPDASPEEHHLCGTPNEAMYLLSVIPITVTENNSSVIYRNVYCARCNGVTNSSYQLWNTTLICNNGTRGSKPFPEDAEAVWDPMKKHWLYTEGNKTFECNMKMIRPGHLNSIFPHVKCPGTSYVDQCPYGTDSLMASLCKGYTARVGWRGHGRGIMYKNQHCLICNGGSHRDVWCTAFLAVTPRSGISRVTGDHSKYSVLLRFARSECSPGEYYDGILKECVHLFPPRVVHNEKNATPIDTCARAKLPARHYELSPDNSTVTIPKYARNYTQGQFRFTENGELEICEKDVPPLPPTILSYTIAILKGIGFSLSVIFLVLHLCAVLLVAELRNLSGITLASLCLALLGGYISFIAGILLSDKPFLWCYACAIVTYYFFMASFFWMLILAFDVSVVLRASVRKFRAAHGFKWRRFTVYSSVAWGIPIISCVAAHVVDHTLQGSVDKWFRPMFGLQGCWFGNPQSHLIFFVIPLAVIMLFNFSFFVYAAWVTSEDPTGQRRNLRVYVKLTILLGLSWIVGLLARALDSDILWVGFSIINSLQGLFIFLSFTMTSKVGRGLSKIFPCFGKQTTETYPQSALKETSFSTNKPTSQDCPTK